MGKTVIAGLCFMALFLGNVVLAQDVAEEQFAFGRVVQVQGDQITVTEYNFMEDVDEDIVYRVTPVTELENINLLTDLVAGDAVVLDYSEQEGERILTTLVKEEAEQPLLIEGEVQAVDAVDVAPVVDDALSIEKS